MKGTDDLLRKINELLDTMSEPAGEPASIEDEPLPDWVTAGASDVRVKERPVVEAPRLEAPPAASTEEAELPVIVRPERAVRTRERRLAPRRRLLKEFRFLGILGLAFAVGVAAGGLVVMLRPEQAKRAPGQGTLAVGGEQTVVAWTVWQDRPPVAPHLAVLGAGGGLEPVVLGIPSYTIASIPGHGLGTVGDAAGSGDAGLAATTVENVLQVHIDHALATPLSQMGALVDALGGIQVGEQPMKGATVISFLTGGKHQSEELRFLRWQEVLAGLLPAVAARPESLNGVIPSDLRAVFVAGGGPGAKHVELPVEDAGAGLAQPISEEVAELAGDRFVATAVTGRQVRLVILNGNGIPGIGEKVAAILVPAGFRLVSSQNAPGFDVRKTRIVASSEDLFPEARLAQELLGVGEVNYSPQPTGVVDVTVIVGQDFQGA